MQTIKKEAGITMLVLVITIIVLGIIGSVLISYSVVGTRETKDKKYLTNLQIVQHAIYERYEQYKITNDSSLLIGSSVDKPSTSFNWEDDNIYWTATKADEKYYQVGKTQLKALGVDNPDDTIYIINYKTQEVYDLTHQKTSTNKDLYNKNK